MVTFAPRPEFAQAPVHLRVDEGGLRVFATNEPMVLRSPGVEWEIVPDGIHQTARAVIDPSNGPAYWNCVAVPKICRRARSTRTPGASAPRVTGGTGRTP